MNQPQLGSYEYIAIDAIQPSPTNPRKNFDPAALEELAASIRSEGIIQPITLRPMFDADDGEVVHFEIVTGERRWRAGKLAELTHVPAIVAEMSDEFAAETQMVENLQRADLHPVEEAEGYRALMAGGAGVEDVAKKAGKTAAHVARVLKLLMLELPLKELFHAGHLTLGHALLLARLTPADQDRVIRHLLNGTGDYAKTPTPELIAARIRNLESNPYMRGRRLVDTTEGQLRQWIQDNVLLSLAKAPWSLEDALLVPEAGPCTTCPKRSGSNAALFADITADEDVCLDAACYGTKQNAFVQITVKAAAASKTPLVQLSSKSGHKEIGAAGTQKGKLMAGQWLEAKPKSCPSVTRGILIDEPGRYAGFTQKPGDVITVCADQKCKVHKHTVEATPTPKNSTAAGAAVAESEEARRKRQLVDRKAAEQREASIRQRILGEVAVSIAHYPAGITRYALTLLLEDGFAEETPKKAVERLGLKAKIRPGWQGNDDASKVLQKHIMECAIGDLPNVAYVIVSTDAMVMDDFSAPDDDESRERMWRMAEAMKVDAAAIAKRVEAELDEAAEQERQAKAASPNAELPALKKSKKKVSKAEQTARKQTAAKKFPAKKKATLTPQQRQNIVNASKEHFAKTRGAVDGKSAGAGERAEQAGA